MAHFYLTLPSNSSIRYYPDNTITHYTTRLENAISLDGDWEVGLVEVQYQHSWYNIEGTEGRVLYNHTFQTGVQTKHVQDIVQLTPDYYESAADIIQIINKQMKESAANFEIDPFADVTYNDVTKRLEARLNGFSTVSFTTALRNMLGIQHVRNPLRNNGSDILYWTATKATDVNRGFTSMYLYCDVLEHFPVGDTKAPLLRIVPLTGKSNDILHNIYEKPISVPLQKKNFDSIEIDIGSDTGKPVPFEYGKVIVTLHFRLRKIPYLLH